MQAHVYSVVEILLSSLGLVPTVVGKLLSESYKLQLLGKKVTKLQLQIWKSN